MARGCEMPKALPCACACGCSTCGKLASSAGGPSAAGADSSVAPLRYFNGDIRMAEDDFGGGAAAAPLWGHTRVYCNAVPTNASHNNGSRWLVEQWPYAMLEGTTVNVVFDPMKAYWFDLKGTVYAARYGAKQTLVYDSANHVYRMTDPDGTFWEFNDFTPGIAPPVGLFSRRVTAGGQTVQVTSSTATQIRQMQLALSGSGTVFEQYDYGYGTAGGANNQLTSVTLSRCNSGTLSPLREVVYSYYNSSPGTAGLSGDLRTATCYTLNASGGTVGNGDTYYYRYYVNGESNGFPHALKYVFRPQAYLNLLAANPGATDPDSASEASVTQNACYYFQYADQAAHPLAVTREAVFGGSQVYTFAYTTGTGTDATPNAWASMTVEREMSTTTGTAAVYTNTVYTNSIGQVLLTDLQDANDNHWRTYRYYDSANRLLWKRSPPPWPAMARPAAIGTA